MPDPQPIRVLIVDDEQLARQRLLDLLAEHDDLEVLEPAVNGTQAVHAIEDHAPDLVFLDVQMPGKTGPEVIEAVGVEDMPHVIFVTAYDHYALQAFELYAIDYLLKPFDDNRFEQALNRARESIRLRQVDAVRGRLLKLLQKEESPQGRNETPETPYLERIAVEMRGQIRIVPTHSVDYITASGPYAELHVGDTTYLIRERMQTLEERLNPSQFFRIHRSIIVRIDCIDVLLHSAGGDYAVKLKDGQKLKVSRSRRSLLEQHLGLYR